MSLSRLNNNLNSPDLAAGFTGRHVQMWNRLLLLSTAILAAYQIAVGIEGMGSLAVVSFTISFGVVLVAALMMIILGYEVLDSSLLSLVSSIIPLSLSAGLVSEYLPELIHTYLIFCILGFTLICLTRQSIAGRAATISLATVHGIAGLVIFLLPLVLSMKGITSPGFILVGAGAALMGVGGIMLAFLKTGHPIVSKQTILTMLPGLVLLMTGCFVLGLMAG